MKPPDRFSVFDKTLTRTDTRSLAGWFRARAKGLVVFPEGPGSPEPLLSAVLHRVPLSPLYATEEPRTGATLIFCDDYSLAVSHLIRWMDAPEGEWPQRLLDRVEGASLTIHCVSNSGPFPCSPEDALVLAGPFLHPRRSC
jgi:hypothetical protein